MPISTTYEIEKLGMTFDGSKVARVDYNCDYDDYSYDAYIAASSFMTGYSYTFTFHDGSTLTMRGGEMKVVTKIELLEGRIYQMGKDGVKWLALCRKNSKGVLKLYPLNKGRASIFADEKHKYNFYKEFNEDYKAYL